MRPAQPRVRAGSGESSRVLRAHLSLSLSLAAGGRYTVMFLYFAKEGVTDVFTPSILKQMCEVENIVLGQPDCACRCPSSQPQRAHKSASRDVSCVRARRYVCVHARAHAAVRWRRRQGVLQLVDHGLVDLHEQRRWLQLLAALPLGHVPLLHIMGRLHPPRE